MKRSIATWPKFNIQLLRILLVSSEKRDSFNMALRDYSSDSGEMAKVAGASAVAALPAYWDLQRTRNAALISNLNEQASDRS